MHIAYSGWRRPAAAIVVVLLLSGCGSAEPFLAHPNLADQVRAADTTTLVVDVTVPEKGEGAMDRIDLPEHRTMGATLTDSAAVWLRRKGFRPRILPPSIGYWRPPPDTFRVVRTPSDRSASPDALPMGRAPFAAEQATLRGIDWGAVRRARGPARRGPGERPQRTAGSPPGHVVVLVKLEGRSVGAEQRSGPGLLSTLLGTGRPHRRDRSYAVARLRIVDTTNERVLWADLAGEEGMERVETDDLIRQLRRVVTKLPRVRRH